VQAERGYAPAELGESRIPTVRREAVWPAVAVEVSRAYARRAVFVLAGLVVLAVAVRVFLAWRIETPWIMVDEVIYSDLAKSFADTGEFLIRGIPYGTISIVYPALIAPAWLTHSMDATYGIAKTLNAVIMSLAAVPVYFWARRLVSPPLSLLAAVLTLLLPAFVYAGTLMTENAFLPAFVLAAFATALALERPTLWAQGFALCACALATGVRLQGVVLFAVIALATGVKVLLDIRAGAGRPATLVRAYAPMLGTLTALTLGYVAVKLAQGASLSSGLGAYAVVTDRSYSLGEGARWALHHAAELSLAVGVVPLAALAVLAGLALVRGLPGPAERAFVAVSASALVLVVIQVGVYASRFSLRIEERNMIGLEPLLLIALVVWLGRGLPRPRVITAVAAAGSAALLMIIPLNSLINQAILSDTFAFAPLVRLKELLSGDVDELRWIVVFGGFDAALAFLFLPRRIAVILLPLFVAAYFAFVTNVVQGQVADYSSRVRGNVPGHASWIDERIGSDADAAYLFGAASPEFSNEAAVLWQLEFWNRSVDGIYDLGLANPAGPEDRASIDPATGRVVSSSPELAQARYVIADRALALAARPLQTVGGVVLYAVRPPLRATSALEGVAPDSWMGSEAGYDRYVTRGGRPGTLTVSVSRDAWGGTDKPARVVIEVGPLEPGPDGLPRIARVTARQTWTVHSLTSRTFYLPTPTPPFRAEIEIAPTFSPADYGRPDTRQLGAQVAFQFAPIP